MALPPYPLLSADDENHLVNDLPYGETLIKTTP
jgi:hypothetical protein